MVVFDLETTGFSKSNDRIIQIAGIRIVNGRIQNDDTFHTYVDPKRQIPPFISDLTGVHNFHVEQAPSAWKSLVSFSRYAGDATLVAHNAHRFDVGFINSVCNSITEEGIHLRGVNYIDSLEIARMCWGRGKGISNSLPSIAQKLGLSAAGRLHDARHDVFLLSLCLLGMVSHLERANAKPVVRRLLIPGGDPLRLGLGHELCF